MKWLIITLILLFVLYRLPLTGTPPQEMIDKAKEIDSMSKDKLELTKNIYLFINNSYTSPIRQYIKETNKVFMKDKTKIWNARGSYMASHQQNLMAEEMLLLTGKFNQNDFQISHGWCEISPHSVLFVDINSKKIAIDTWFADNGGGFNCFTSAPCGVEQKKCL